jgi:hypothetical protein
MELKLCPECDTLKPLSKYGIHKSGPNIGKLLSRCKKCNTLASQAYYHTHREKCLEVAKKLRYANGVKPMSENKSCPSYLGVVVAEKALSRFFDHIIRMPINNPDYDFICGQGFKIDVKSACLSYPKSGFNKNGSVKTYNPYWMYLLKKNPVAQFFLLIAFNDREDLEPLHVWLIPAHIINMKTGLTITNTPKVLAKWLIYEKPLTNVISCCDQLRGFPSPNPLPD